MRYNGLIQIILLWREKVNYKVNNKRIKRVNFFATTCLVGRNNNHVPRIRQTAITKRTLREHDTERCYEKVRRENESGTTTLCF